jgi:hypothetical protein
MPGLMVLHRMLRRELSESQTEEATFIVGMQKLAHLGEFEQSKLLILKQLPMERNVLDGGRDYLNPE